MQTDAIVVEPSFIIYFVVFFDFVCLSEMPPKQKKCRSCGEPEKLLPKLWADGLCSSCTTTPNTMAREVENAVNTSLSSSSTIRNPKIFQRISTGPPVIKRIGGMKVVDYGEIDLLSSMKDESCWVGGCPASATVQFRKCQHYTCSGHVPIGLDLCCGKCITPENKFIKCNSKECDVMTHVICKECDGGCCKDHRTSAGLCTKCMIIYKPPVKKIEEGPKKKRKETTTEVKAPPKPKKTKPQPEPVFDYECYRCEATFKSTKLMIDRCARHNDCENVLCKKCDSKIKSGKFLCQSAVFISTVQ